MDKGDGVGGRETAGGMLMTAILAFVFAFFFSSVMFPGSSLADTSSPQKKNATYKKAKKGNYTLVFSYDDTFCQYYVDNLNSFPADEPPMVHVRKFNPRFERLKEPTWEEIDPVKHLDLFMMWIDLPYYDIPRQKHHLEQIKLRYKKEIINNKTLLHKTIIDINNDGANEILLRMIHNPSNMTASRKQLFMDVKGIGSLAFYFPVDDTMQKVTNTLGPRGSEANPFYYNNKVYSDYWKNLADTEGSYYNNGYHGHDRKKGTGDIAFGLEVYELYDEKNKNSKRLGEAYVECLVRYTNYKTQGEKR